MNYQGATSSWLARKFAQRVGADLKVGLEFVQSVLHMAAGAADRLADTVPGGWCSQPVFREESCEAAAFKSVIPARNAVSCYGIDPVQHQFKAIFPDTVPRDGRLACGRTSNAGGKEGGPELF